MVVEVPEEKEKGHSSEDGDEGEDTVEQGAGVCHQQLLALHLQGRDEDLGRREAAPADDDRRDDYSHHTPGKYQKHCRSHIQIQMETTWRHYWKKETTGKETTAVIRFSD